MSARGYLVFFCLVLVSGCTQFRPLPPQDVKVGYIVKVQTTNNERYKFRVTDISESELIGERVQIRMDDIKSIKKEELTHGGEQATGYILGAFAGAFIGGILFAGASF
jgi:hypothetical protein